MFRILNLPLKIIVLLLTVQTGFAQSVRLLHYSVSDGLPSSIIYRCTQDKRGFLWFGTESGISRFDGKSFRNFSTKDGLTDTEILDVMCDQEGFLWLVPFGGSPMRFDPVTQTCRTAATDPELRKIAYKGILSLSQTRNGDVYLYYENAPGLFRFRKGKVSEFTIPLSKASGTKSLHELDNGKILLSIPTMNKLLDPVTGTVTDLPGLSGETITVAGDSLFSFNSRSGFLMRSLLKNDRLVQADSVMIGGDVKRSYAANGRFYFCNKSGGVDVYDRRLQKNSSLLPDVVLNTSYADREGNVWLCSYTKGVYCMPANSIRIFNSHSGLADDYISAVLPLPGERLLTGFLSGTIQELQLKDGALRSLTPTFEKNLGNRIRRILRTRQGGVVALSDLSIMYSDDPALHPFDTWQVYVGGGLGGKDVCEYAPGQFMVASTGNLLRMDFAHKKFDTLFRGRTTAVGNGLHQDAWFSTLNGVYYVKDVNTQQVEFLGPRDSFFTKRINSITCSSDGLVWLASANAGIAVVKDFRIISHINQQAGLASDFCRSIYLDEANHKAWVATNNGISCIRYQIGADSNFHYSLEYYSTNSGLPDNDVGRAVFADGNVYAATANGLAVFPPLASRPLIPVHIVDLTVEGKPRSLQAAATLRYFEDDISIGFTGICYTCAGKLDYQYRLLRAGNDTSWINTQSQVVNFSALPSGQYVFEVRTAAGSAATRFAFTILRPWFATFWFWLLCGSLLFGIVYLVYRQRVKIIAERSAQEQQVARLELQTLQAQMNPHFIFNSLNAIGHFIAENKGEKAQDYLGRFSRLMRLFLESSRSNYISLAQEKELLTLYLELEQLRFNNRFRFSIELEPGLNTGYEIPSMLIQPFAENAVNHGFFNKKEPDGLLRIRFYRDGTDLCCEIDDNGIGRTAAAALQQEKRHISRGLQITEERLKTLEQSDGLKTRILATDKYLPSGTAAGTTVLIRITDPELAE